MACTCHPKKGSKSGRGAKWPGPASRPVPGFTFYLFFENGRICGRFHLCHLKVKYHATPCDPFANANVLLNDEGIRL